MGDELNWGKGFLSWKKELGNVRNSQKSHYTTKMEILFLIQVILLKVLGKPVHG